MTTATGRKRVSVREGLTGILRLRYENGEEEQSVPDYRLEPARELLLEWQELPGPDDVRLKDSYWVDGINWFPTVVNYAYGRVFGLYVRYRPLVDQILEGTLDPHAENNGDFSRFLPLLSSSFAPPSIKATIFHALVTLNNRLVVRRSRAQVLFFRFAPDDFRTAPAKQVLDELGVRYVEAVGSQKHLLLSSLTRGGTCFFHGGAPARNRFRRKYRVEQLAAPKRRLFERTTQALETMMSTFLAEHRTHARTLRRCSFRTLYGIDDTQIIFPLLYACQDSGVRTVAHQHGAAYERRHASYLMEGLRSEDVRWFDTLIVWDDYWKERFLALSNLRPPDGIRLGGDPYGDQFRAGEPTSPAVLSRPRAILVPYEFLTNTYEVGRYVAKLIQVGYDVWFKPRSDETLHDQLDAYCLPQDCRDRVKIVHRLTPGFMGRVDVVAGTMSTLVYQLIPFGKATWLLETDHRGYLDHLADEGYVRRIRYDDLDKLEERHFAPSSRSLAPLTSPLTLRETLARYVVAQDTHGEAAASPAPPC